jgi:hypothetical protein
LKDEDLDIIAEKVSTQHYIAFLTSMAHAWLRSDRFTKQMMRAAWEALIAKHQLTA